MSLKIAVISDTHGHLPTVKPVDLVLICGDVCPVDDHSLQYQKEFLDTRYRLWLSRLEADEIVMIAGNHDFFMQERRADFRALDLPCNYLEDSSFFWIEKKLLISGSPWVPNLPNWAFHATEEKIERILDDIPDSTDILVTHGPPRSIRDRTVPKFGDVNVGSTALRDRCATLPNLKLHVFGHIHEARGEVVLAECRHINASYVDENYLTYPDGVVYLEL